MFPVTIYSARTDSPPVDEAIHESSGNREDREGLKNEHSNSEVT